MASKLPPPKLGPKLTPGNVNPNTGVTLFEPRDDAEDGENWGCRIKTEGLTLDLDPTIILDRQSRAVLLHTSESLKAGQKPDGSGASKPLKERALSEPNREAETRGFKSGELADGIKRTQIKVSGGTAKCRMVPPPSRNAYVGTELKRGYVILSGEGKARQVAIDAANEAVAAMMTGRQVEHDDSELDAGKVAP
jgi:hypothetical protein